MRPESTVKRAAKARSPREADLPAARSPEPAAPLAEAAEVKPSEPVERAVSAAEADPVAPVTETDVAEEAVAAAEGAADAEQEAVAEASWDLGADDEVAADVAFDLDPTLNEFGFAEEDYAELDFGEGGLDPSESAFVLPTAESLLELIGSVWGSFVDGEVPLDPGPVERPEEIVSGEVSISGAWAGKVVVSFDVDGARQVAARMFLTPVEEIEQDDLFDTVGEVANMIGGNVKAMFDGDCKLGLPVVHPPESAAVPRPRGETVAEVELSWSGTWLSVVLETTAQET